MLQNEWRRRRRTSWSIRGDKRWIPETSDGVHQRNKEWVSDSEWTDQDVGWWDEEHEKQHTGDDSGVNESEEG